jgi:hypothetical protein
MKKDRNSDTFQVLWFDAVVLLVIAVIATLSNARSHIALFIHHAAR